MSILSKVLTLRIPSNIIYRALKDTRLERLFPEFFIGVERKVITDKKNKEIIPISIYFLIRFHYYHIQSRVKAICNPAYCV
jgi:hypothetical protein